MPKRKTRSRTSANRDCKKPKISLSLREKKKKVNYDDNKYDAIEYLEDNEALSSDCIEISSEDSKKEEVESNEQMNNESGDGSDVVFLESKPHEETVDNIVFEDIQATTDRTKEDVEKEASNASINISLKSRSNSKKSISNNSINSAISLSSSETKSNTSGTQRRKSKRNQCNDVNVSVTEELYYVEKIIDMKIENGKRLFFLKWEGFSDSYNTWEPEENLETNIMVKEFLNNLENKDIVGCENYAIVNGEEIVINDENEEISLIDLVESNFTPSTDPDSCTSTKKSTPLDACSEIKANSNDIVVSTDENKHSESSKNEEAIENIVIDSDGENEEKNNDDNTCQNDIEAEKNKYDDIIIESDEEIIKDANCSDKNNKLYEDIVIESDEEDTKNDDMNKEEKEINTHKKIYEDIVIESDEEDVTTDYINEKQNEIDVQNTIYEDIVIESDEEDVKNDNQKVFETENKVCEDVSKDNSDEIIKNDSVKNQDSEKLETISGEVNVQDGEKICGDSNENNTIVQEPNLIEDTKTVTDGIKTQSSVVGSVGKRKKERKSRKSWNKFKRKKVEKEDDGKEEDDDEEEVYTGPVLRNHRSLIEILDNRDSEDDDNEFTFRGKRLTRSAKLYSEDPISNQISLDLSADSKPAENLESSESLTKSPKNSASKSSKDPNVFFPTNMPQTVQEIFMVEKILKMKVINGVRKFYLKWEGFPDSENTWEPEENLECPELIKEFLKEEKEKEKEKKKVKKKKSASADSLSLVELPADVIIKEPVVKPRGFPRSREPDSILGAGMMNDKLMFLIKWKNVDMANLVSASRANLECPQVVIRYYEDNLNWKNNDQSITTVPKENLADEIEYVANRQIAKVMAMKHNTTRKKSMNCMKSLISPGNDHDVPRKKPTPIKQKIMSKYKNNTGSYLKPKNPLKPKQHNTSMCNRNIDPKIDPSNGASKSRTGSSSSSMMNMIKNFKDRKIERTSRTPLSGILQRPLPTPVEIVEKDLSRQYDSREIPIELSPPPKIELPKVSQFPILRPINSYRPDFNPRRFAPVNRPILNSSQSHSTSQPIRVNAVTAQVPLAPSPMNIKPTLPPPLQAAPNANILTSNSSLNIQMPNLKSPLNIYHSLGNRMSSQPMGNQYLQVSNSSNTNHLQVSHSSMNSQIPNHNPSVLQSYLAGSDTSLNSYNIQSSNQVQSSQIQPISMNSYNSLNHMRALTSSIEPMSNNISNHRSLSNQSDPMNNYIQNFNDQQSMNANRNPSRMQLAAALQSRYQQNQMLVMHPNGIPNDNNSNNSVVIYQNQPMQQLMPQQYQYVMNTVNPGGFNSPTVQVHQQPQSFYNQQTISNSPTNSRFILPKMECYGLQTNLNQPTLQQAPYQHLNNQNSDLIQNSYLNLRAFL